MRNKFIVLLLVMLIVVFSGCIQSDIGKINDLSSKINANLKNGDNYYNNAAEGINEFSLDSASTNCDKALSEFKLAKSSADEGLKYAQNSNDAVFINYMKYSVEEIDLRITATQELKEAIPLLKVKNNSTGNAHITLANQYMDKSLQYKYKKDVLVKNNPSKFKK